MKLIFISNYFNHHQRYLSDALSKLTNFKFIETMTMREERKKLGYSQNDKPDYVKAFDDNIIDADVLVVGGFKNKTEYCFKHNDMLAFKCSERVQKTNNSFLRYPIRLIKLHLANFKLPCQYLLSSSAYAPIDYSIFFMFKNRMYKWGYFPQTRHYDLNSLFERKNRAEILWCGRFLDWKHPDVAIKVALKLKADGYNFVLKFIGTGALEDKLHQMIVENHLEDNVKLLGPMPPEKVRDNMEQAGIYIFTSDRQEGWGAVLNESMNSGCAVIAAHTIGAVPYLLKNNENGLIYDFENFDALYSNVRLLLDNPDEQRRLGEAAYKTITEEWNAEVAAERLVNLSNHILDGEKNPDLYKSGPCSRAEIIRDNWVKNAN